MSGRPIKHTLRGIHVASETGTMEHPGSSVRLAWNEVSTPWQRR